MKTLLHFSGLLAAVLATGLRAAEPPAPAVSPSLVDDQVRQEAVKHHIRPAAQRFAIATPPPAPRAEVKPIAPAPDQVWKAGYWAVVDKAWKWTPGEWGTPPVASSVWIEGKYDPKTQQWSPPYWQPDRPSPSEEVPPTASPVSPAKVPPAVESKY